MPHRRQKSSKKKLQKSNVALTQRKSDKSLREQVINYVRLLDDPREVINRAIEKNMLGEDFDKEKNKKLMEEVMVTFGFDNDHSVVDMAPAKYRGLAIELRRQLIKDFSCTIHAEKVLVDTIVGAYIRNLFATERMTACLNSTAIHKDRADYVGIISKEVDRSNRHLITAYHLLVQIKKPPINIQVRTQNAFVAQAQQFNAQKSEKTV